MAQYSQIAACVVVFFLAKLMKKLILAAVPFVFITVVACNNQSNDTHILQSNPVDQAKLLDAGLFSSTDILKVELEANLYEGEASPDLSFVLDPDSSRNPVSFRFTGFEEDDNGEPTKIAYDTGVIRYQEAGKDQVELPVKWRTRGKSRALNPIPPLKLKFSRSDQENTIFYGLCKKVKLVTHGFDSEQPNERHNVAAEQNQRVLANLLIGNTDYGPGHNTKLFVDANENLVLLPYDFDLSDVVQQNEKTQITRELITEQHAFDFLDASGFSEEEMFEVLRTEVSKLTQRSDEMMALLESLPFTQKRQDFLKQHLQLRLTELAKLYENDATCNRQSSFLKVFRC